MSVYREAQVTTAKDIELCNYCSFTSLPEQILNSRVRPSLEERRGSAKLSGTLAECKLPVTVCSDHVTLFSLKLKA